MSKLNYYRFANHLCKKLEGRPCAAALKESIKYKFSSLENELNIDSTPLVLDIVQRDVIAQAAKFIENDLNPLIVNTTRDQACGYWDTGGLGFEESLAYRSTLSMSLTDSLYPLAKDECVYSPTVQVFRDADYLAVKSFSVSVVSLVALPRADFSIENDKVRMRNSIRAVFNVAIKHEHKSIIFNAFGIKDDNNPMDVAQLMGEVFTEYAHRMRHVAIVFDNEVNSPNFMAFRKYLKYTPSINNMPD